MHQATRLPDTVLKPLHGLVVGVPFSADSGIWAGPSSSMYKPHCGHSERRLGGITCLSLTGWLFTIVFTYIGFACMITGKLDAAAQSRKGKAKLRMHLQSCHAYMCLLLCFAAPACEATVLRRACVNVYGLLQMLQQWMNGA